MVRKVKDSDDEEDNEVGKVIVGVGETCKTMKEELK